MRKNNIKNPIEKERTKLVKTYAENIAIIEHQIWFLKSFTNIDVEQRKRLIRMEKSIQKLRKAYYKTDIDIYEYDKHLIASR